MTRTAFVDGSFVPLRDARVSLQDRGYLFADGVYEYIAFYHHRLLDLSLHLARLERSLAAIEILMPMSAAALSVRIMQLIEQNLLYHGGVYIQITRGQGVREHAAKPGMKPVLSMMICAAKIPTQQEMTQGVAVVTMPDMRWKRCDIKSVGLLPNILAKTQSSLLGAKEGWQFDAQGHITEGTTSNAFIIDADDVICTQPPSGAILPGITRDVVLKMAYQDGISVSERAFTLEEAYNAKEAFLTSTSANVMPVTRIDKRPVGNGNVGKITQRLMQLYAHHVQQQTGWSPL